MDRGPPWGSSDQSSDQAITLANRGWHDEPEVALAIISASGGDGSLPLEIAHNRVNRPLVAAGVHTHATNQVGAGLGTALNQSGADRGTGQGGEIHRCRVVNCVNCSMDRGP